ncbi:hypothetical protein QUF72_09945 [Desulfobacterales bacterium HSG2]|nr:hypothetical protein [Desulfobacterales bacterium HSG2]
MRKTQFFFIISLYVLVCTAHSFAEENAFNPQPPRYLLNLNADEYSLFNDAVAAGLKKHGGAIEFDLKVAKIADENRWMVTIHNGKLLRVLKFWLGEKAIGLLSSVPDIGNLNKKYQTSLKAVTSVAAKTDKAQEQPIWDEVTLSGLVTEESGNWLIKGKQGNYQITGEHLENLKHLKEKSIVAQGMVKVKDRFEVTRFTLKKENTLEIFVMSQCPFGQMAESSVINYWNRLPDDQKPKLEIRYIFYRAKDGFTSLHGESEVTENLVQMAIRDNHPEFFHQYLLERIEDKSGDWRQPAEAAGLDNEAIQTVESKFAKERETLIQAEYNYVMGTHQIFDGSPTYIWESERIDDIRQIEVFKDLTFSTQEKCSH